MRIKIIKKSTNQELHLSNINSLKGYREIVKALKLESFKNNLGRMAPGFEIKFTYGNKKYHYYLYDRGYILMDHSKENYHIFKYGNSWHQLLEEKLMKLIEENPKHFFEQKITPMKIALAARLAKSTKVRKASPSYGIVQGRNVKQKLVSAKIVSKGVAAQKLSEALVPKGAGHSRIARIAKREIGSVKKIKKAAAKKRPD
jgi:hypothetical protein